MLAQILQVALPIVAMPMLPAQPVVPGVVQVMPPVLAILLEQETGLGVLIGGTQSTLAQMPKLVIFGMLAD